MANNDTQAVYKAYINNKQRELVRLGFGEVLDIEDEEQVLRVLKGVSDVSELVGIATTNNPAESILKMKHLTYNEVLVGRAQDDYNSDYDARVAEINKLRIQQSSQEIAKGVSNEPEVPQPTDELELKKNDMLENMFSNNVLFNNLGSNNQLEDDDDDDLVEEDEYDYSNETDSNTDSNLSMFDEEEEELEDEEPDYSEGTNLDIFDEPEDEDEDEEIDYSAEYENSTNLAMFDDEDDDEDEDEEIDYSDEDEDSTDLSLFDDEDEDEDEEVDYSAEDEDEDTSENLSLFDEDEDEYDEDDYSDEDEEFEDDNLDMFDEDEDGDEDEEYDYSEGDSDSEEDLSMFDEDEDEDDDDEYSDEEDEDDDSDADISIFDDEDEDDDVIEVKTEPKPAPTSNVTPITSTPQRNVQPKPRHVQRRKLDASDRAFLGIVNNGLNIVAKTQKYIKGERK
jgi:AAA ATPase containing von willebrand factor type A (VWA)-like domain